MVCMTERGVWGCTGGLLAEMEGKVADHGLRLVPVSTKRPLLPRKKWLQEAQIAASCGYGASQQQSWAERLLVRRPGLFPLRVLRLPRRVPDPSY